MLPEHVMLLVADGERVAIGGATLSGVLPMLRRLSVDDFGLLLWSMPHRKLPGLSAVLPPMAPLDAQKRWTGGSGYELLVTTTWFARLLSHAATQHRQGLAGRSVLDVGCGYGRFVRLMYYYTDPGRVTGVDAWQQSIDQCAQLPSRCLRVDEMPTRYPIDDGTIDLAFAYSVLTHLSEAAFHAVLTAVRATLGPNGLFILTIRPVEYWTFAERSGSIPPGTAGEMAIAFGERGIAFRAHPGRPGADYGDTSISLEYIDSLRGWRLLEYDRSVVDPYQLAVVLEPR